MDAMPSYWNTEQAAAFARLLLGATRQYGVVFFDDALRITAWNEGAHFITGWRAGEVLGRSTSTLFVPEDVERRMHEHEANTVRVVGVAEDERWHLRKDGSRFWSSGASMAIQVGDAQDTRFVKIFRDVTHLRTRMRYLENVQHECNLRQHEKNVFIGTIAHEMRNPLSPLKTALELMKRLPDPNPRHAQPIKIMDRQVGFLERLIEDLVDLTRVQTGKMSIAYGRAILQEVLFEALDACGSAAGSKGTTLHHVMPPVPIEVDVDASRLMQVVVNLLNNAIKYTPAGGNIWLSCTVDQTHFACYVKDDGQGIGAALLPRIFDIFTQADGTHAERGAGLGIGLSVVKEIVTLHGGTVEVRSEGEGRGSEFIVRIPQRHPRQADSGPRPPPVR
ncbi:PAS domain-containing sensor histidine kinase [Massilia sp. TN1-12]|uniref:PAS domain-containing sensor histidine kinase n=1 Tax=Massilia paldalensis TaxID=3377675 RepID=UPI00384B9B9E